MRQFPRNAAKDEEELLSYLIEHKRLVCVVSSLTREVERLKEDNLQLRAAVDVYREINRRCSFSPSQPEPSGGF